MADQAPIKSVLIAVPSTGGVIKAKTTQSLMRLMRRLTESGIHAEFNNIDGSDVVTVRNLYANLVLNSKHWDGLLFIDSDMEFDPRLVAKMIRLNVDIVGAACTTREIDLAKFGEAMRTHGELDRARAESSRFNVLRTWNAKKPFTVQRRGGFYTMAAVGMAVCLIRKQALQAMVDKGVVSKRVDVVDGVSTASWGFFDYATLGEISLLEDYSFCYRWTKKMGRPLWVCTDEEIRHLGEFGYSARYDALHTFVARSTGSTGAEPVSLEGASPAE